MKWSNIACLYY